MVTIKVKYRPSAVEDREGTIFYQIIHGRKVRIINTSHHILPEEWDESKSSIIVRDDSERKPLILSLRERIRRELERLSKIAKALDGDGILQSADEIVDEFRRYEHEYSVFNFMESLITKLNQNGKIRTAETYASALKSFRKFRGDEDILLDSLTSEIMEAYEAWNKHNGNTPNTISFYIRILRAAYNRAVEDGVIENRRPFRRVYTGIEKTTKRALPLQSLKKIKALDLTMEPPLEYARDMFLMSFYLRGMSLIDMAFLKKTDLNNGHIVYRRHKTGQQLSIAWTGEMQAILDKYPSYPTPYLLPIIRSNGINERCAYKNAGDKINYNLKKVAERAGIAIPLTMYVARHSWASTAKEQGISLRIISEGMGHDSEATTQIYLASLDTSAVDQANSIVIGSL